MNGDDALENIEKEVGAALRSLEDAECYEGCGGLNNEPKINWES